VFDLNDVAKRLKACTTCKSVGKVLRRGKVEDCSCLKEAGLLYRLDNSNIPERFRGLEFRDYIYKNSGTYQRASKYLQEHEKARTKGVGLYLFGPPKSGQTPLAISVLKELARLNYTIHFTPYSAMLSDLADGIQDHPRYGRPIDFLCIDGITEVLDNLVNFRPAHITGENVNFAVTYLDKILSQRFAMKLPTIITARASIPQVTEKLPSLGMTLAGNFLSVECVSEDFRGQRMQEKLHQDFAFDQL
jgi:hypothetical protein